MKKGIILYVTEGRDAVSDWMDLTTEKRLLGVDAICLATSETELTYGWWQMLARGVQQVSCMSASYDIAENTIRPAGHVLRLCG
jgi:hypothetical protein